MMRYRMSGSLLARLQSAVASGRSTSASTSSVSISRCIRVSAGVSYWPTRSWRDPFISVSAPCEVGPVADRCRIVWDQAMNLGGRTTWVPGRDYVHDRASMPSA